MLKKQKQKQKQHQLAKSSPIELLTRDVAEMAEIIASDYQLSAESITKLITSARYGTVSEGHSTGEHILSGQSKIDPLHTRTNTQRAWE